MSEQPWWWHDSPTARYDVLAGDGSRIGRFLSRRELVELVRRLEQADQPFEVKPTAGQPGAPA